MGQILHGSATTTEMVRRKGCLPCARFAGAVMSSAFGAGHRPLALMVSAGSFA